jgi:hypothetical protein
MKSMERRGIFGDRRVMDRREPHAFRPADERRSGADRRGPERRAELIERRHRADRRHHIPADPAGGRRRSDWAALPPLSRLIPALVVVAASLVDLGFTQATTQAKGWSLFVVAWAFPIAAYALRNPQRSRSHLPVIWFAVGLYVMAAGVHITYMLMQ